MNDLFSHAPIPIEAQIKEIEREIAQRERVYPRWVAVGKMSEATARDRALIMNAVLRTLRALPPTRNHQE